MKKSVIIKGGRLLSLEDKYNYDNLDILIENGIITKIEKDIQLTEEINIVRLDGEIVSPGFIDSHCHVDFNNELGIGLLPDTAGVLLGNSTVIDAGSTGFENFTRFKETCIDKSITKVYALLNLSKSGIDCWSEVSDSSKFDLEEMKSIINEYPREIIGIKVRADKEPVGDLGIYPFQLAHGLAHEIGLPFIAHIGEFPPSIKEQLEITTKGDLITHCYNEYSPNGVNNSIVDETGIVLKEAIDARNRGVLFDVGHGGSSFSFEVAKKALAQGFYPDIISTDIYTWNYFSPVISLAATMNKMLYLGMNIEECVKCVTTKPAEFYNLKNMGHIKLGYQGDLTIFHIDKENVELVDSMKKSVVCDEKLCVDYVVIDGQIFNVNNNVK